MTHISVLFIFVVFFLASSRCVYSWLYLTRCAVPPLTPTKPRLNHHRTPRHARHRHRHQHLALNLKKNTSPHIHRRSSEWLDDVKLKKSFVLCFCSCSVGKEQWSDWNGNFWVRNGLQDFFNLGQSWWKFAWTFWAFVKVSEDSWNFQTFSKNSYGKF